MRKLSLPIALALALVLGVIVVLAAGSLNLPAYSVAAQYGPWTGGASSTMDITLSSVGAGFDVSNGVYAGWCIQDHVLGGADQVLLFSSDDPNMPADALSLPWDKINYVLNHKQGDKFDVQTAIWLLLGEQDPDWGISAAATAMVQDADANGTGFVPGPGQVIAVLLYSDGLHFDPSSVQEAIIEVPVTPPPPPPGGEGCTPGYWRNHFEDWPATGYSPSDDFDTVFGVEYFSPDITLGQAVKLGGGGVKKLARHGTAALLSAAHPDVDYPYTVAEVIAFVQAGDSDTLVAANELGCNIP